VVPLQERRHRINPKMQDDKMRTRIKELRARYDMTQEDLANKVGVRRETIGFLEKGKYNPSLKLAYKVAITLETTIDELFIFDESDLK
jgi:DNA-binding XRE family transcriptional regulator